MRLNLNLNEKGQCNYGFGDDNKNNLNCFPVYALTCMYELWWEFYGELQFIIERVTKRGVINNVSQWELYAWRNLRLRIRRHSRNWILMYKAIEDCKWELQAQLRAQQRTVHSSPKFYAATLYLCIEKQFYCFQSDFLQSRENKNSP